MNLDFPKNTILSCFPFFFLIIDHYLLIPVAIAQPFNPIMKLLISIGEPSKEAKIEIEIHQITVETKIRKWSI